MRVPWRHGPCRVPVDSLGSHPRGPLLRALIRLFRRLIRAPPAVAHCSRRRRPSPDAPLCADAAFLPSAPTLLSAPLAGTLAAAVWLLLIGT